jgi:hypothetical protein
MKRIMSWTVMLLVLLVAGTETLAADIHFSDYFFPTPLSRACRYIYSTPSGYPGFTVTVTKLTSGPYAGHYRWGDYNIPEGEEAVWRIADFEKSNYIQSYLLYADSLMGELEEPARIQATYETEISHPSPIPGSSGIYWFFRVYSSVQVLGKTYQDAMLWVVFDSKYPATVINTNLGLPTDHGMVSTYTLYAKGIGELVHTSAASDGSVRYQYGLQSTGTSHSPTGLSLLLD